MRHPPPVPQVARTPSPGPVVVRIFGVDLPLECAGGFSGHRLIVDASAMLAFSTGCEGLGLDRRLVGKAAALGLPSFVGGAWRSATLLEERRRRRRGRRNDARASRADRARTSAPLGGPDRQARIEKAPDLVLKVTRFPHSLGGRVAIGCGTTHAARKRGRYRSLAPDFHRLNRTSLRLAAPTRYFVGNGEDSRRYLEVERAGGLEVDDQLESCRGLDRQVAGFLPNSMRPVLCKQLAQGRIEGQERSNPKMADAVVSTK